jgi:hypothetical protein
METKDNGDVQRRAFGLNADVRGCQVIQQAQLVLVAIRNLKTAWIGAVDL